MLQPTPVKAARHRIKGWVLTVRSLPGRHMLLGTGVVDDDVVFVVGAALLPHLHHLHLREGRAPLQHVFGTQGHQAARFQLASAKGGCKNTYKYTSRCCGSL